MKLSFICASNNIPKYESLVLESLEKQDCRDFETILVDTTDKKYPSAALALNEGAERATGDYLCFLHHDITFEPDFVSSLISEIDRHPFYIAGPVGVIPGKYVWKKKALSSMVNGPGKIVPGGELFKENVPLETVDECFFVIPREVFRRRPLQAFYPSWHLYAVEYCLWAKTQGQDLVRLLPVYLWHESMGYSMDESYYKTLEVLRKTYRCNIYTTMNAWPRDPILYWLKKRRSRRFYAKAFGKQL